MNAGCFPNPSQKKSVSFAFGTSFPVWFVGWGCSGLGLARIFCKRVPKKKSVLFAFGLSFPFGSWGGVAWA